MSTTKTTQSAQKEVRVKSMKSLGAKPKLISIILDDEATLLANDGYALEFFTYDRQPLPDFMRMIQLDRENPEELAAMANRIMLDENGVSLFADGTTYDNATISAAFTKVVAVLGN